jgi:hypothetical protein
MLESWVAEPLAPSQEGLTSMELFTVNRFFTLCSVRMHHRKISTVYRARRTLYKYFAYDSFLIRTVLHFGTPCFTTHSELYLRVSHRQLTILNIENYPNASDTSRVYRTFYIFTCRGDITGFWIGWLDLLRLIHSHSSVLQAIQRNFRSTYFPVHRCTCARILSLH